MLFRLLLILIIGTFSVSADSPWEIGRYFKGEPVTAAKTHKSQEELLEEILEIQKKQLDTQNKILEVLQNEYDPKPKYITVDGKPCVANSSAECFQMPIMNKDARAVPVLKAFVSNPNVETAKNWLQWQAKFFKTAFKGGESIMLALNKYGTEAYPLNYDTYESDTIGGYGTVLKTNNNNLIVNSLGNDIELYFFFGKNGDADTYALDSYAEFAKSLPNLRYHIVFYQPGAAKYIQEMSKILINVRDFLTGATTKSINPKMFEVNNIYATPSVGLFIKNKNIFHNIMVGRTDKVDLTRKVIDALEYEDVLKDGHSAEYKMWGRVGNYSSGYYKNYYNLNLNIPYMLQMYKGK